MKKPANQSESALLTKAQLALKLQLSVRGVECLSASRKIPVLRISRRCVRYDWEKVRAALQKFEVEAVAFRPDNPQP